MRRCEAGGNFVLQNNDDAQPEIHHRKEKRTMKSPANFFLTALMMIGAKNSVAQHSSVRTGEFAIMGSCSMCRKAIEAAALKKGVKYARWDESTGVLTVKYDSARISADAILRSVAYAGYDNSNYLAPADAYDKLPDCCKYRRLSDTQAPRQTGAKSEAHAEKELPPLAAVYEKYFELKNAFVAGDPKDAAARSTELLKALEAVPMQKLAGSDHELFMKSTGELKLHAEEIAKTSQIARQREHFSALSKPMFGLMKAIKPAYTVYLDQCPMYNDGKGADWISRESEIKNPYYGSSMLTCGKVIETIR